MIALPEASTVDAWQEVLHRLVLGEWEDLVEVLGSVDEVVRVALRDAQRTAQATAQFQLALNLFVSMWQPDTPMSQPALTNLFNLVEAFTPPEGLLKIMGHMERVGFWMVYPDDTSEIASASAEDDKRALLTLEPYFPSAPKNAESPAFRSYVELLEGRLNSEMAPYCLRRLLELRVVSPANDMLAMTLKMAPEETIEEIIQLVVETNSGVRRSILAHLFAEVGKSQSLQVFDKVIARFGCAIVRHGQDYYMETPFDKLEIWRLNRADAFDEVILRSLEEETQTERPELEGLFS